MPHFVRPPVRWVPWARRWTVVQPWTCLWVVPVQRRQRCDGCDRRVRTRNSLVATFPSRQDWAQGRCGSPQTGTVYCGDCAHVWYGVWQTDLERPLPASQRWDCWGPLVALSRLVVAGSCDRPRYAYRLSPHWRPHRHHQA